MSSPLERLLTDGLVDRLIAIQKSQEIYEKLSKWERRILLLDEREIRETAKLIALEVLKFDQAIQEETGNKPTSEQIMQKIQEELEKI